MWGNDPSEDSAKELLVGKDYQTISYKNNIDLWYDKGSGISEFTENEKNEMILIGSKLCRRFISQCTN